MRTKILSCALCALLIVSILVLPASALGSEDYKYAIFNGSDNGSYFVFEGVEYGFGGYDQFKPAVIMFAHSDYLFIVRTPSLFVNDFSLSFDDTGFYLNLPADTSIKQFRYTSPTTLDPEFTEVAVSDRVYIPGDLDVVIASFLCNLYPINWAEDSGYSGEFLPARPIIYYWPIPSDDGLYAVSYQPEDSSISFPVIFDNFRHRWGNPNPFFGSPKTSLMFKSNLDNGRFYVIIYQSSEVNGNAQYSFDFYVSQLDSGSFALNFSAFSSNPSQYGYGEIWLAAFTMDFDSVTGNLTGITRDFIQEWDRRNPFDLGTYSLSETADCFYASTQPVYLASSSGSPSSAVLFWQNPRGNQLSPQYRPVPPLDQVLPDYNVSEDVLLQDALDKWQSNFTSVYDFIDSFVLQFESSFAFCGAVFSLFADIPVLKFFLYCSLLLGFVMVLLNLAGSAIRAISKGD